MANKKVLLIALPVLIIVLIMLLLYKIGTSPGTPKNGEGNNGSGNVASGNLKIEPKDILSFDKYSENYFSIQKPINWNASIKGSCSTFSFVLKDKNNQANQIFYFGEIGPVYLADQQKSIDKTYMDMGGMQIGWYDMPVVSPLTSENFLKNVSLMSDSSFLKKYIAPVPKLNNLEIISSKSVKSPMQGDAKLIRAIFKQGDKLAEGLFYITVSQLLPVSGYPGAGIGYGFIFIGISAEKDKFEIMEPQFMKALESFAFSDGYVENCLAQQSQAAKGGPKLGKTLSEISDIIIEGWDNRSKSDDVISERRSDTMLGKERIYDPSTKEVYDAPSGFYDDYNITREKYKMDNLQKLPETDWNLWISSTLPFKEIY